MALIVKGITPTLKVIGDTQQLIYDDINPSTALQLINTFTPTLSTQAAVSLELLHDVVQLDGFRLMLLITADGKRTLKIQRVIGNIVGDDILSIDDTSFTIAADVSFTKPLTIPPPVAATDAATKQFVDNHTWTTSQITDFTSSVQSIIGSGATSSNDQTYNLAYASAIEWDWSLGNIASLTLTGNAIITPVHYQSFIKGDLIVKQDATGGRSLTYGVDTYQTGTLQTAANAINLVRFLYGADSKLYLQNTAHDLVAADLGSSGVLPPSGDPASNKNVFNFEGVEKTLVIPDSTNKICRIRMIAGGGGQGQGWTTSDNGPSGAGGFTVYHFNTTNYIGATLRFKVGGGGKGGVKYPNSYLPNAYQGKAGAGGYPNGGNAVYGYYFHGGGGGRSDIRITTTGQSFDSSTILAIAGGGGGGTGYYSTKSGAGGGVNGQTAVHFSPGVQSTGGSQTTGGTSGICTATSGYIDFPPNFIQAGYLQGAGSSIAVDTTMAGFVPNYPYYNYVGGGGGDGYYGGGTALYLARAASGGSGYINTSFTGYLTSYNSVASATYPGNYKDIPTQASSDSDFTGGYGAGCIGGVYDPGNPGNTIFYGLNGGDGRIIIEFF